MTQSKWGWKILGFTCVCLSAVFTHADGAVSPPSLTQTPDAKILLEKVEYAIRGTNYRARLTYEQSGKLEVMEVSHGVINGIEYEKVYFLNGEDRELAKHGRPVDCETYGGSLLRGVGLTLPNGRLRSLEQSYAVDVLGQDRVAGRLAWIIQVIPMDEFRHGMLLAVDQDSYLPLKTMYIANGRKVLERLHFVSLETGMEFQPQDFPNSEAQENIACVNRHANSSGMTPAHSDKSPQQVVGSQWKPEWVPPGFVLVGYSYSEEDGHMETYTDGLASFSIFIKPLDNPEQNPTLNLSTNFKKGATIIVMRVLDDENHRVHASILGEIPSKIARRILSSINYAVN